MGIRTDNVFGIHLSDTATHRLRQMGIIDGNKKVKKGRNLSGFINRLILDFTGINKFDANKVKVNLLLSELNKLYRRRALLGQEIDMINAVVKTTAKKVSEAKKKMEVENGIKT